MSSPTEEFVLRRRRIPLDAAADQDAEGLVFTHLRVSDASDAAANFSLRFANRDNDPVVIKKGIRLENFRIASGKVWLSNAAQPGKFVEIETWSGPQVGPPRIIDDAGLFSDVEIIKQRFPWENRNPIFKSLSGNSFNGGPAAGIVLSDYTVPAGKRAAIVAVRLFVERRTAGAPAGDVTLQLKIDDGAGLQDFVFARLPSVNNAVGDRDSVAISNFSSFNTGASFQMVKTDSSTGGTTHMEGKVSFIEYDA